MNIRIWKLSKVEWPCELSDKNILVGYCEGHEVSTNSKKKKQIFREATVLEVNMIPRTTMFRQITLKISKAKHNMKFVQYGLMYRRKWSFFYKTHKKTYHLQYVLFKKEITTPPIISTLFQILMVWILFSFSDWLTSSPFRVNLHFVTQDTEIINSNKNCQCSMKKDEL